MEVVLLGSGGYYPNDQRHTACIWIPEYHLVLDAGTGAYRLNQVGVSTEYDIFLSHAHLDHVAGLTYLLPTLLGPQTPALRLYATSRTLAAIAEHLFAEAVFPVVPPWELIPLTPLIRLPHGVEVKSFPLTHPGGSTGFRLDFPQGQSIAYITDTTASTTADYLPFIESVDLLIHECNFSDDYVELAARTGHSTVSEVLAVAQAAHCGRLVLVHFDPFLPVPAELEQRAADSDGQILIGHDLLRLSV